MSGTILISTGKKRNRADNVPCFYKIYSLARETNVKQLITSATCYKNKSKGHYGGIWQGIAPVKISECKTQKPFLTKFKLKYKINFIVHRIQEGI